MAGEYAESLRGTVTPPPPPTVVKKKKKKKKAAAVVTADTGLNPTPIAEDTTAPTAVAATTTPDPTNVIPSYEVFKAGFAGLFDNVENEDSWMRQMYAVAQNLYKVGFTSDQMADQLLNDTSEATRLYRDRFAGIFELKKRKAAGEDIFIPSVAQYNEMSKQMMADLRAAGLNGIATNASIAKIIGANVDYTEFAKRIETAFKAIDNADQWLKAELATNYGNLSREDLALGLLGGQEGSDALKKKIDIAGIRAGALEFGLQTQMNAEELYNMGVDRQTARKGYEQSSRQIGGLSQASRMFGQDGTNIQSELEQQNVLGKKSEVIGALKSQVRSQFEGSSGVVSGSLKRRTQV
jgi:hypothetical protein